MFVPVSSQGVAFVDIQCDGAAILLHGQILESFMKGMAHALSLISRQHCDVAQEELMLFLEVLGNKKPDLVIVETKNMNIYV